MSDDRFSNVVFRELEDQNPGVAHVFQAFRQHVFSELIGSIALSQAAYLLYTERHHNHEEVREEDPCRQRWHWRVITILLITSGVVALCFTLGPSVLQFLSNHWKIVIMLVGCVCLGAGIVLLVSRIGTMPLRNLSPPNEATEDPLNELKDLAERTASRLRSAYRFQLSAVVVVGSVFVGLIVWSGIMVSKEKILYASAFGSGSIAMVILTHWKWQPFERINEARRLADNADTLATGLRLRIKTISEIEDPSERAKAQWAAVEQYIARS